MLKAIFFDIDNTLLSFSGYVKESMREGFKKFGLREYEDWMFPVFDRINNGLWQRIERGELDLNGLMQIRWNMIFEELGISFDGTVFEKYFRDSLFDSAVVIDGAPRLIQSLSEKFILASASNGPYAQQVNRLGKCGLLPYFRYMFVSEELGASKPSRAFFDACFERLNAGRAEKILPEETMIVGDSLTSDILGGVEYGMMTCWFNPEGAGAPETMRPDFAVDSLAMVETVIRQI